MTHVCNFRVEIEKGGPKAICREHHCPRRMVQQLGLATAQGHDLHRDGNGSDEAMFRRYNGAHSRFDQPHPYDSPCDLTDPQSFNHYVYVQSEAISTVVIPIS